MSNYVITSTDSTFTVSLDGADSTFPKDIFINQTNVLDPNQLTCFNKYKSRIEYTMYTDTDFINVNGDTSWTDAEELKTALQEVMFLSSSGGSGAEWGNITGVLSSQTDLQQALDDKQDNININVVVNSLADLPTPVGGVITLSTDNINYIFTNLIDFATNKIVVTGDQVRLSGVKTATCGLAYSGTETFITCSKAITFERVVVVGIGATKLVEANGLGAGVFFLDKAAFLGGDLQVDVSDYSIFVSEFSQYSIADNSIILGGNYTSILINKNIFQDISLEVINLNGCTTDAIGIELNTCVMTASSTFLTLAVDSGNINPGGEGTITSNKINNTLNGTSSVGYSPLDELWYVSGNNQIKTSDRILPTGWGSYFDDESAVLNVDGTPTLLEVNGLGGNTNEDHLPNIIRGVESLWDSNDNCIKPITEGDSYDIRIQLELTNTSSNPTRMDCVLDIGGGLSPTIPIATDAKTLKTGTPQTLIFSFPIYSLSTFISNGGQIFLSCNSGSAEITGRSILIVRTSSGAI